MPLYEYELCDGDCKACGGRFTLRRAPTGTEDMIVRIIHADYSITEVASANYAVSGTILTLTDVNFVLSLASTDRIYINYQPRSVL